MRQSSEVRQYRKRQHAVKAIQWTGENSWDVHGFMGSRRHQVAPINGIVTISVPDGILVAMQGDYIIKDDEGNFTTQSPAAFERDYEEVGDSVSPNVPGVPK